MKRLALVLVTSALLGVGAADAGKYDAACNEFAQACVKKGGQRGICNGQALTNCKANGTYLGPYSGRTFHASGR
jgi:hypothetical protein